MSGTSQFYTINILFRAHLFCTVYVGVAQVPPNNHIKYININLALEIAFNWSIYLGLAQTPPKYQCTESLNSLQLTQKEANSGKKIVCAKQLAIAKLAKCQLKTKFYF